MFVVLWHSTGGRGQGVPLERALDRGGEGAVGAGAGGEVSSRVNITQPLPL